mmetsp:Transcript_45758/g.103321  ORF Transcript_45758/g.103321 Transcript_45758/m.103321 type:complete len:303 (-) Transcript_45758:260-1168(-)
MAAGPQPNWRRPSRELLVPRDGCLDPKHCTVIGRVSVHAFVVEGLEGLEVLFGCEVVELGQVVRVELEVEHRRVLGHAPLLNALGDVNAPPLDAPTPKNLSWRLGVFRRNRNHRRVVERFPVTQRAVGLDNHPVLLEKGQGVSSVQERVDLDLVDGRGHYDPGVGHELLVILDGIIGKAKRFNEPFLMQTLKGDVCVDVLPRHGPVNAIEVQEVAVEVLYRLEDLGTNCCLPLENRRRPYLGGQVELRARDPGVFDARAHFGLVTVKLRTVEESVAEPERLRDALASCRTRRARLFLPRRRS